MKSGTVIVKAARRNVWANVNKYPNCYDDIVPYFTKSGAMYTGLDKKKEAELSKEPEFSGQDLSRNSEYWKTFFIRIGNEGLKLDLSFPNDRLKYYFLLNHKDVKTSDRENVAGAKYVMIDELEEAKKVNVKATIKLRALDAYKKMTPTEKKSALRLYNLSADDMDDELVDSNLFSRVDSNPEKFVKLWVENEHKDTEALITRAVGSGILRRKGNALYLGDVNTGECIGNSLDQAVEYLEEDKNQPVKLSILKQLKVKA